MASGIYNTFKAEIMKGTCNLASGGDTLKCGLLDNSHAFTAENDGWADVSANEISGTGYTAGGATLSSQAVSVDDTDDEGVFDAADTQWTTSTFSAYHAVVYDDTVTSPADILLCSIDFGGVQTVSAGTFTIQWASEGIINIG